MSAIVRAVARETLRLARRGEGEPLLPRDGVPLPRDASACATLSRRRFMVLAAAGAVALLAGGPAGEPPARACAARVDGAGVPSAAEGYWDGPGEDSHRRMLAFMAARPEAFALPTFRPSDMGLVTSGVSARRWGRRHNGDDYAVSDRPLAALFRARLSVCWQPGRRTAEGTIPGGGWVYTLQYEPSAAFRRDNPGDPLARGRFVAQYLHCARPRGLTGDCLRERGYDPKGARGMPSTPPGVFLRVVEPGEVFGESGSSGTSVGPTGRHLDLRFSFTDERGRRRYSDTKMYIGRLIGRGEAFNRGQHYLLDYCDAHQLSWERVEGVFRSLAAAGLPRTFRKLAASPVLRAIDGGQDFALDFARRCGVSLEPGGETERWSYGRGQDGNTRDESRRDDGPAPGSRPGRGPEPGPA